MRDGSGVGSANVPRSPEPPTAAQGGSCAPQGTFRGCSPTNLPDPSAPCISLGFCRPFWQGLLHLCVAECGEPGVSSTPSCPTAAAPQGGGGNTGTGTSGRCSLPEAAEGSSQGPRTRSESPARRPAARAEQHRPLRKTEPLVGLGALLRSPSHSVRKPFSAKPPSKSAPAWAAELGSDPCGQEKHRTGHRELQQPQGTPQTPHPITSCSPPDPSPRYLVQWQHPVPPPPWPWCRGTTPRSGPPRRFLLLGEK